MFICCQKVENICDRKTGSAHEHRVPTPALFSMRDTIIVININVMINSGNTLVFLIPETERV